MSGCVWELVCVLSLRLCVSGPLLRGEETRRRASVGTVLTTRTARSDLVVPFPSGLLACLLACCLICKVGEGGKAFRALTWGEETRIDIADVAPLPTRICKAARKRC